MLLSYKKTIYRVLFNLGIYSFAFLFFYLLIKNSFILDKEYTFYFIAYLLAWFGSSLLSRKFKDSKGSKLFSILYTHFISFFLMLGLLSIIIFEFNLLNVSRLIIISSVLSAFIFEIILVLWVNHSQINTYSIKLVFSSRAFIAEFFLFTILILYLFFERINFTGSDNPYDILLVGLYINWILSSLSGHRFHPLYKSNNYWNFIWLYLKSYIIIIALNYFIIFILRLSSKDASSVIIITIVYTVLSFIMVTVFYFFKKPDPSLDYELKYLKANLLRDPAETALNFDSRILYKLTNTRPESDTQNEKLKNVYLRKFPKIYQFLTETLELNSFDISYSVTIRSRDIYNIEILPDEYLKFFLNLHHVNDIRRINNYFIEVNKKLINGGIFVGRWETIRLRHLRFLKKYPYYFAQLFYFVDFIWRRVFPKVPILQKFYFLFTKGYNRAISFAEGLGRLYYCGFEVVNLKEIDDSICFVVKKVKEPETDSNPSYGPLIKMRRTGANGKPIYVYKLRTMHPYSEYLQQLVFEKFNLQTGGKFNNDFRITYWGKLFRKLWLDELPMLVNFIKGDLKLVGVRPLSNHYLSLYKECLIEKRNKFKPGLIPPFYVDMPETLQEIMASEERYLDLYEKNPLMTDVKYFFKAAYNIFFKKARSK